MNFVVVYDPPGASTTWDMNADVKAAILEFEGVVDVRRSRVYSLKPEMFSGIERPVTVLCWGVEDRYSYEGRSVDEVVYVSNIMDIENAAKGLVLVQVGEHSYYWMHRDEIPEGYERQVRRGHDATPTSTFYAPPGGYPDAE